MARAWGRARVGGRTVPLAVGRALGRCSMEDGVVDAATRKRRLRRWHTECRRCEAADLPLPPRPYPYYGRVGKKKSRVGGDVEVEVVLAIADVSDCSLERAAQISKPHL